MKQKTIIASLGIIILSLIVIQTASAANDPGHDTLYIEQQGNSELNGTLNITQNLSLTSTSKVKQGGVLTLYADGSTPGGTETYISATGSANYDLYIETQGSIYFKSLTTGMMYIGKTGTPTDLNASGALYVRGLNYSAGVVCLSNGSYCPAVLGGANVTGGGTINTIAKFTAATSIGNSTIIEINNLNISIDSGVLFVDGTNNRVGIGTTSPNNTLTVAGTINATTSIYQNNTQVAGSGTCAAGQYVNGTTASGVTCNTPTASGDGNNYTTGAGINVTGNSLSFFMNITGRSGINNTIIMNDTSRAYPGTCTGQQALQIISATAAATCVSFGTSNLTLSDITTSIGNWSLDKSAIQANITNVNTTVGTHTTQISGIQTNITNVNATANLKALPGTFNCGAGQVLQNITTLITGITGNCTTPTATGGNLSAQGATAGYIPRFQNGTILNNSIISQSGNTLTINGNISMPASFYIGLNAVSNGSDTLALGEYAQASNQISIAIGYRALANFDYAIAIGRWASATAGDTIAIGDYANSSATNTIALGQAAKATSTESIAIGYNTIATQTGAIAIGSSASSPTPYGIAIGMNANATANYAVAIGYGVVNDVQNSTKFGGKLFVNGNVNLTTFNVSAVNCIVFDTGGKICSGA